MNAICKCETYYSPITNSLLRYCPDCMYSTGGTMGNVCHNKNCKYWQCAHEKDFGKNTREAINHMQMLEPDVMEWYYGPFIFDNLWSGIEQRQQNNILKLQKTLYEDIQKKLIDLDRKLFERTQEIIRLKTNKEIYVPYLMENNI